MLRKADSAFPAPPGRPARHTERMALRFTVQGDEKAETVEGFQLLLTLGLETLLPPTDTIGNGWMARAVPPRTTKAPTVPEDDRGPIGA